ncbi:MAG: hypothetical protein ACRECZ_01045 [Methylocella sp.]
MRIVTPLPSAGELIRERPFESGIFGSSGIFSVILSPYAGAALAAMLDGLKPCGMGYSWGGFESPVFPFDCRSYRGATAWNPLGPASRFSVGLEDIEDLKEDSTRGLNRGEPPFEDSPDATLFLP